MTIKEMHYDFKKKLNKIDSQQNRNLRIPEIDWTLNEALELFVKMVAQPRVENHLGFEIRQRTIDDIRELVVRPKVKEPGTILQLPDPARITVIKGDCTLPRDYWFFVRGHVEMKKGDCIGTGNLYIRRHDEEFEESPLDRSSFEWREVNGVFFKNKIALFDDGTFKNQELQIVYVKRPTYMHNAEDFGSNGKYKLPSGVLLSGSKNCELAPETHREIVDIAVALASSEMQSTNYQQSLQKLRMNQLQ